MSASKGRLDRKHFIEKLEQVKFEWQGEPLRLTFGQTAKRGHSSNSRQAKSKSRTHKLATDKDLFKGRPRYPLDRSKESKESKESLSKSTHSYYLAKRNGKRSGSVTDKYPRSHKSKELTATSNAINSTFEMQSVISSHKKKQSNFESTLGSKLEVQSLMKGVASPERLRLNEQLRVLVFKSESVLEKYKAKNEVLEQENRLYKRKYQEALKKIRHL
jgi:hypothetical protein